MDYLCGAVDAQSLIDDQANELPIECPEDCASDDLIGLVWYGGQYSSRVSAIWRRFPGKRRIFGRRYGHRTGLRTVPHRAAPEELVDRLCMPYGNKCTETSVSKLLNHYADIDRTPRS